MVLNDQEMNPSIHPVSLESSPILGKMNHPQLCPSCTNSSLCSSNEITAWHSKRSGGSRCDLSAKEWGAGGRLSVQGQPNCFQTGRECKTLPQNKQTKTTPKPCRIHTDWIHMWSLARSQNRTWKFKNNNSCYVCMLEMDVCKLKT